MTALYSHFHPPLLVDASLMGKPIAPLMPVDCFNSFAFGLLSFSFFVHKLQRRGVSEKIFLILFGMTSAKNM